MLESACGQTISMDFGRLALRGTIGGLFIGHGTQKLFGWFGGHGLDGTGGFFESALGLRPGKRHATAAGVSEATGGALLALGALTPLAAAMVTGPMVTAIRKVHAPNGPWVTESGWEYNAVLIAAVASLAETGPGAPSVDGALLPGFKGKALALAAVAAGVAGSYLFTEVLNEGPPDEQADAAEATPGDPAASATPDGQHAGATA